MSASKEETEIYAMIGATLIHLQYTEQSIRRCMTFVFQEGSGITLEELETQLSKERKKTIGYFLGELRKRAELHPSFDKVLDDFLECRNKFVHNIESVPGWDLDSAEGKKSARMFISRVFNLSNKMLLTFSGFLRAWQKQVGLDVPMPPGSEEFFKAVDQDCTPMINHLVFKKERQ